MADDVDERLVAREGEIVGGAVGADRLVALAVQVAPVGQQVRALGNPERVGPRERCAAGGADLDPEIARRRDPQAVEAERAIARREGHAIGQALRPAGWPAGEALAAARSVGLPQRSRATSARRKGSPTRRRVGRIARQLAAGPGTRRIFGECRQLDEVVGRKRVDEDLEGELPLAGGLQADPGRALRCGRRAGRRSARPRAGSRARPGSARC